MSWICPKCETENPDKLKFCEVCDSPRDSSPMDKLKEKLKEKYTDSIYVPIIKYHYQILDSADKGDANSQYMIGEWIYVYQNTYGSDDYKKIAALWYKKAAMQGHGNAQLRLAFCYLKGNGVPTIKDEAIKWYKKAAENNQEGAQEQYVKLKYDNVTYKSIVKYRLSLLCHAEFGTVESQYQIGEWFRTHTGHSSYNKESYVWYNRAARQGHHGAMLRLANFYENSTSAMDEAIHWYKRAARGMNKDAQLRLVELYLYGQKIDKDIKEAAMWCSYVEDIVTAKELCNIGYAYDIGDTVPVNKAKAVEYYLKASKKGSATAQYNLGVCYENGTGVEKSKKLAVAWYEKAAKNGNTDAQERLNTLRNNQGCLSSFVISLIALVGITIIIAYM